MLKATKSADAFRRKKRTSRPVIASAWLRHYILAAGLYLAATWITNAYFMADTMDYVNDVIAFDHGPRARLWEAGHLFWRPLGCLLYRAFGPLTRVVVGPDAHVGVAFLFVSMNWLAGLIGVLSLYDIVRHVCQRQWIAIVTTIGYIFSHGFLNFTQSGTSYTAGLSLLLLGLSILVRSGHKSNSRQRALLAGGALTGAVCLWLPYVWAMPAAVASPIFLLHTDARRWRLAIETGLALALFIVLVHVLVFIDLGVRSVADVRDWVVSSPSIGTTQTSGITRMVFGFARSFIMMGDDGILFKRFIIQDQFNPVSPLELLRLSLLKFVLFYAFLASIFITLLKSSTGKRILGFSLLSVAPVLIFAARFDGGAVERYLPLYPAIFISLAHSLSAEGVKPLIRFIVLTFVGTMVLTNTAAMAWPVLNRQQDLVTARIDRLQSRYKPHSRLYTVNWQDQLVNFNRSFPFNPVNRYDDGYTIGSLVTPGTISVSQWREDFAKEALSTWDKGGDVWVSRRVLSSRPRLEWNWAEGDDKRVSWTNIYNCFSQLDLGEAIGGDDGFLLLLPSVKNKQLLSAIARESR